MGISPESDEKLMILTQASRNLEQIVLKHLEDANSSISMEISSMSIKGGQILKLLKTQTDSNIIDNIPRELSDVILNISRNHELEAAKELGIDQVLIRGIFTTGRYPLEVDEELLSEIKHHLMLEGKKYEFYIKRKIAERLLSAVSGIEELIRGVMEFDLRFAMGEFCIDNGLCRPEISSDIGVGFKRARNLNLRGKIQPIDYVIGVSSLFPHRNENILVITGANSGGKSTLLELVGQVAILTHMGFFVPAEESTCSLIDELYYFGRSKDNDAGAFESILKTFEGITRSSKRRLILADEVEAVTEPGAAAKILTGLLDWFKNDENTLIAVVSHLGEDIEEHIGPGIRIDGIEASGLDRELNLIVDRNPVYGKAAKSTPELILERLSKLSSNKDFYEKILERFKHET
jgi:dsDNA-specific endonuclease/ATPase MutS2